MSPVNQYCRISALALLLALGLDGCAVTGGGYDGDVGVSVGYYEPYGYGYGGWGSGYRVGPARGDDHRPDQGSTRHNYRPADSSRRTPSIPTKSRSDRPR